MAAGNAVIGALRAVLGVDTAQFETGLKSAALKLGFFAGAAAAAGSELAKGLGRAVEGIAAAIPKAINEADKLGKMAQSIGIPVEELAGLKHAADLSGVSLESLGKGVAKLSRAMVEAGAKPTSEAANAFRALGLSATNADGSLKASSQVMTEVAGKFEGLKDGAGKTAVAMALFGKSGADLIPLLNSGQAGLAGMIAEARQLGIVISTDTAKSAEAFNDNLRRLGVVKDGIIVQLTAKMLPALETLSQRMIDAAKSGGVVETVSNALIVGFEVVARGAMLVADNIGLIVRVAAGFVGTHLALAAVTAGIAFVKFAAAIRATGIALALFTAIKSVSLRGLLIAGGIVAAVTGQFDKFSDTLKDIGSKIQSILPEGVGAGIKSTLEGMGLNLKALETDLTTFGAAASGPAAKGFGDINIAAMGGKTAIDGYLDSLAKQQAAQLAEIATAPLLIGAKESLRVQEQANAIATANNITLTGALKTRVDEAAASAALYAQKLHGVHLIQQNRTPAENYRIDLENAKLAMEALGKSTEEVGQVQTMIAERYGATWHQAGESVAGSIADIGKAFGKENKAMAMTAKIAGAIQATISMLVGAAKALELPFPANLGAMAVVIAKGAALVASIRGTSVGGFKTGGSFTVPGGLGGGDKVHAMFEPGERVDVWRPGESGEDDPRRDAAPAPTVIQMHFPDPLSREFWSGAIAQINALGRDGYRLEVAAAG